MADRYPTGVDIGTKPDHPIFFISTHPFTDMRASFSPMYTMIYPNTEDGIMRFIEINPVVLEPQDLNKE